MKLMLNMNLLKVTAQLNQIASTFLLMINFIVMDAINGTIRYCRLYCYITLFQE